MSTVLRGSRLIDICPPSISYDMQVQSASEAFDYQMVEIIDDTGQVVFIPNIMGLTDSNLVDILAWQFHVDFYDATQSLDFRKQLVQISIEWHMRKGTVSLLQEVLDTFWPGGATLQEWYEYDDPLPPNYPIDDPLTLRLTFTGTSVSVPTNKFTINAHGLNNNDMIQFETTTGSVLPTPLSSGLYYYVINSLTNSFQVSLTSSGAPVVLTSVGTGTNQIWKGAGSWHDRYRFRAFMDANIITSSDQILALDLINAYKPVSRWFDGWIRATVTQCNIGWYGAMLQFFYRESETPTNYP